MKRNKNKITNSDELLNQLEVLGISTEKCKKHDILQLSDNCKKKIFSQTVLIDGENFCGFCRDKISNDYIPIGCPIKYHHKKIILEGSYCSLNCMIAYVRNQYSIRYREVGILLYQFLKLFFEITVKDIEIPLNDKTKASNIIKLPNIHKDKFIKYCEYSMQIFISD